MASNRGARYYAATAVDISDLAEAAKAAVIFSYGVNTRTKTGEYLDHLSIVANRDNKFRIKHYDIVAGDPNALSIEYGHAFYRGVAGGGEGPKAPTGNYARPTLIMTKAFALFPGV